jgi:hypothetical protein
MAGTKAAVESAPGYVAGFVMAAIGPNPVGNSLDGIDVTGIVDGATCYVRTGDATYRYYETSVAVPVFPTVVQPLVGPGRWLLDTTGVPFPGYGGPPVNVDKSPALPGVSLLAARADHKHDIDTAAPVNVGLANAEGGAVTIARSDHVHAHGDQPLVGTLHAVVTPNPGGVAGFMSPADKSKLDTILTSTPPVNVSKSAAVVGGATDAARSDHKHDIDTAAPVNVGVANVEGGATSLARSDHVHNHANQPGGLLHALVSCGGDAGFMSAADKCKLDLLPGGGSGGNGGALFEDFVSSTTTANLGWTVTASGTSAVSVSSTQQMDADHLGIRRLRTGTTATGRACHSLSTDQMEFPSGGGSVEWLVQVPSAQGGGGGADQGFLSDAANTYWVVVGLGDNADGTIPPFGGAVTGQQATGVYFEYDAQGILGGGASGNFWKCVTANAGVYGRTVLAVPVTPTTWVKLRAELDSVGPTVRFYIDGVLVATHTSVSPVVGSIPGAGARFGPLMKIVKVTSPPPGPGSEIRAIQADYCTIDYAVTR